jgi:hypothetical protein
LPEEPPPLPQVSRKRILPAFVLCFTVSAHRIYAGRYLSGVVQMVWAIGGFAWMYISAKGLMDIVNSGSLSMDMVDKVADWEQVNGMPFAPILALILVGIWIAFDATRLLAGKFTDGEGLKIKKWM